MNEFIFVSHLLVNLVFLLGALRFGKKALVVFFVLESILANLFVLKQIALFGLTITASDVYVVGAILALNLIQEYFGKEEAKKAVIMTFFGLSLFLVMSQFQLYYLPSSVDYASAAYAQILTVMPRLLVFSVMVFLVAQKVDLEVYSFLRKRFSQSFLLRLGGAALVSQTIDTVLFSFLALYGVVANVFHVIAVSLVIKYLLVFTSASLIVFLKKMKVVKTEKVSKINRTESEENS